VRLRRSVTGSTTTEVGTLQIVHALSAIAKWGLENFSQWFESEVMGSLREGGKSRYLFGGTGAEAQENVSVF
jgi:hypothetical protein